MLATAPLRHAAMAGRDLIVRFRAVVRLRAETRRLAGLRAATLRFVVRRLATLRFVIRFLATLRFVVRFLATLRFVVRRLATLRLEVVRFLETVRFLELIRFFAAAFLAAIFLAFRMRAFAFNQAFLLAASFLEAAFFAAMCFFTNRRAALIFFSAALTAFLALLTLRAHIFGVFGFEIFLLAFVVAIFQSSFSRKSNGGDITAKDWFKLVLLRNRYQKGPVLPVIFSSRRVSPNRICRALLRCLRP